MTARALPPGLDRPKPGRIRARYRDANGKQHSKTWPERPKAGEPGGVRVAQAWLRAQRAAVDGGLHVAPNERTTVAEYAEQWAASRPHKPRTRVQDANYLRHLRDTPLGGRPLRLVRTTEVQAFVTNRSDSGLAPQTVRNLYTWVKAAFQAAVEDRLIAHTPCSRRVMLPRVERPQIVPLTVDQVRDLADAMEDRYRIGVLLQAALGLRISELLALQVGDVDFLRRTVRIERQLDTNGRAFVGLKYDSRRTVPLARDLATVLSQHIASYPPSSDGVILTTTHGNPIRSDLYSDRIFKSAVRTSGIPDGTTSHDLRHHFASVLLSRGVPANVVADHLGHTSPRLVYDTYGHLMPDAEDVTRQALDGLWASETSSLAGVARL